MRSQVQYLGPHIPDHCAGCSVPWSLFLSTPPNCTLLCSVLLLSTVPHSTLSYTAPLYLTLPCSAHTQTTLSKGGTWTGSGHTPCPPRILGQPCPGRSHGAITPLDCTGTVGGQRAVLGLARLQGVGRRRQRGVLIMGTRTRTRIPISRGGRAVLYRTPPPLGVPVRSPSARAAAEICAVLPWAHTVALYSHPPLTLLTSL